MKKAERIIDILFVLVAVLAIAELMFVRGMFTWILAAGAVCIVSIAEAILSALSKSTMKMVMAILFALAIVAGYAAIGGV